jgi:hypothetical protein
VSEDDQLRELVTTLIKKLDVALPEIGGFVSFVSVRSGGATQYHGPQFDGEMEALRELLGLEKPAAHPREFYPPDYCKPCDGTGQVPGGTGVASQMHRMNPDMPPDRISDICSTCRGSGGRGLPIPMVDRDEKGECIMATDVEPRRAPMRDALDFCPDRPLVLAVDCSMCSGEACNKCGAGCWNNSVTDCEHDSAERHEEPEE